MEQLKALMREKAAKDQSEALKLKQHQNQIKEQQTQAQIPLPKTESRESLASLQAPISVFSMNTGTHINDVYTLQEQISQVNEDNEATEKEILEIQEMIQKQLQKGQAGNINKQFSHLQREANQTERIVNDQSKTLNIQKEKNDILRAQIDTVRMEINKHEIIIKNLKSELATKKKQVGSVNRVEKTAAEQRMKAQKQLDRLILDAEKEKNEMDAQINKLSTKIDKENQIKDVLKKKAQVIKDLEEMYIHSQSQLREEIEYLNIQGDLHNQNDKLSEILTPDTLQEFEMYFQTILKVSKQTNLKEFVQEFTVMEKQNFELKQLLNEQRKQFSGIELQSRAINQDIEVFSKQGLTSDNDRLTQQLKLLKRVKKHENKMEIDYVDLKKVYEKIIEVKKQVLNIFDFIQDQDLVNFAKEFQESRAFTAENALDCLGQIENLLLNRYQFYGAKVLERVQEVGLADEEAFTKNSFENPDMVIQALKNLTTIKPKIQIQSKIKGNTIQGNKGSSAIGSTETHSPRKNDIQFEDSPFKNFQQAMATAVNVLATDSDNSPTLKKHNSIQDANHGRFDMKKQSYSSKDEEVAGHHPINQNQFIQLFAEGEAQFFDLNNQPKNKLNIQPTQNQQIVDSIQIFDPSRGSPVGIEDGRGSYPLPDQRHMYIDRNEKSLSTVYSQQKIGTNQPSQESSSHRINEVQSCKEEAKSDIDFQPGQSDYGQEDDNFQQVIQRPQDDFQLDSDQESF